MELVLLLAMEYGQDLVLVLVLEYELELVLVMLECGLELGLG
jgi:hypothetical protein